MEEHETPEMRDEQKVTSEIKPGMEVKTTGGDLGEDDVSKPKVDTIIHDQWGRVKKLIVRKGLLFKKDLEIPADRVQDIDLHKEQIVVDVCEEETQAMSSVGTEEVASEKEIRQRGDVLDTVETAIPTAEGMREMELGISEGALVEEDKPEKVSWWRIIGPGFLGGMAGNDASAVTAYALDGARSGFSHLWLLLLSTPMYQAVLYACAKVGRVTQKGFADVLRENYSIWVATIATLALICSNIALMTADLVAVGTGFALITGASWELFVIPVALTLWYLTVYRNFESLKKIFIVMSCAFIVYIITAFMAHPNWGMIFFHTLVPRVNLDFVAISNAMALLGATLSPYSMYWQVQGEKEEQRPGDKKQQLRFATLDISSGVMSGNLVAYFIIISTASTLYAHHTAATTTADIAQSLVFVLGPLARYLFAIGLIGSGLVAIPILLASTSYAVAGTFGWSAGLSKKPWQNEGFYLILTTALFVSIVLALFRVDPITLIFWANIISGILAPVLIIYLLIIGNSRKIMGEERLGWLTNSWLVFSCLVLIVATILLFYGLATGQG